LYNGGKTMSNTIDYRVTIDATERRATFTDTHHNEPIITGGITPGELAALYRDIACYFLEMAHNTEEADAYFTPAYNSRYEWEQVFKMFKGGYHNGIIQREEEQRR